MQIAMCHYSFHRRWQAEGWDPDRLCAETAALGVPLLDLHTRLGERWLERTGEVAAALAKHRVGLAGVSFSNGFTQPDREAFDREVARVRGLIRQAAALGARTARIFGGHLPENLRLDPRARCTGLQQVADGLGAVMPAASEAGVTLALENHGGLPGTSAEVLALLGAFPQLRATIDLGNFLGVGEEPVHGAGVLAPHGAYVHVKWVRKIADATSPWGWRIDSAQPGEGDVDLDGCFAALRRFGFTGTIAIEYEGKGDEQIGVPAAVAAVRAAVSRAWPAAAGAA